ncbi:hypothetical protein K503DRAFT_805952 [Rhizopogon vinicolor AM-OR11-026]|uniref:Uncharacterized protein n=1 Tax=Rhizopogon vinicolor AM-OR11-026 TaxID=1314800 RepID=A0A1B7MG64_9AGAM|nr:hypothetical protein K503DRAFT_805952 [Rhizopogon vinicolor AM-OR11-026]
MQPHLNFYWLAWTHLDLFDFCFSIQDDPSKRFPSSLRPCLTALHFCDRLPHAMAFPSGESANVHMLSPFPFHVLRQDVLPDSPTGILSMQEDKPPIHLRGPQFVLQWSFGGCAFDEASTRFDKLDVSEELITVRRLDSHD